MLFANHEQSINEPYELKQLEEKFKAIGPKAKKEGRYYVFHCSSRYYYDNIGVITELQARNMAVESLKVRAKYAFYKILLRDRKIKTCHCGTIIFKPKPWVDICNHCMKRK